MLAGGDRAQRPLLVQAVDERYVDGVDLGVVQQRLIGRADASERMAGRKIAGTR
jgi:hypothetical protein